MEWIKRMNHCLSQRWLWRTQGRRDGESEGYCRWPRGASLIFVRDTGAGGREWRKQRVMLRAAAIPECFRLHGLKQCFTLHFARGTSRKESREDASTRNGKLDLPPVQIQPARPDRLDLTADCNWGSRSKILLCSYVFSWNALHAEKFKAWPQFCVDQWIKQAFAACCFIYRSGTRDKFCNRSSWLTIRIADPHSLCVQS